MKSFDETERPLELLRKLEERRIGYADLIKESGGLAIAAYRLARARCHAASLTMRIPTLRELSAAASEISQNVKLDGFQPHLLAGECEHAGLAVITPLARDVA